LAQHCVQLCSDGLPLYDRAKMTGIQR